MMEGVDCHCPKVDFLASCVTVVAGASTQRQRGSHVLCCLVVLRDMLLHYDLEK